MRGGCQARVAGVGEQVCRSVSDRKRLLLRCSWGKSPRPYARCRCTKLCASTTGRRPGEDRGRKSPPSLSLSPGLIPPGAAWSAFTKGASLDRWETLATLPAFWRVSKEVSRRDEMTRL